MARSITSRIHLWLHFLLGGDDATAERFLGRPNPVLTATLRSVRPVVAPSSAELQDLVTAALASENHQVPIPLRSGSGVLQLLLKLGFSLLPERISGMPEFTLRCDEVTRADTAESMEWRSPDSQGRLPAEQWVGSPALRLARLFNALTEPFGVLDVGPTSDRERAWALQYADGDIHNGGLHQFYWNSTGNFAPHFPSFARVVGAERKSSVLGRANSLFDPRTLADRAVRQERLDDLDETELELIEELTDEYYDCDEPLDELLVAYVEADPGTFLC